MGDQNKSQYERKISVIAGMFSLGLALGLAFIIILERYISGWFYFFPLVSGLFFGFIGSLKLKVPEAILSEEDFDTALDPNAKRLEWHLEASEIKENNRKIVWLLIIICLAFFVAIYIEYDNFLPLYIGLVASFFIYFFALVYKPKKGYRYILNERGIIYMHRLKKFYPWEALRGYCLDDGLESFLVSPSIFLGLLTGGLFGAIERRKGREIVIFTKNSQFVMYLDPSETKADEVISFLSHYLSEVDMEGKP